MFQWLKNEADYGTAGVKLGRRDVVRVAQLLINDAEAAIAEANPAGPTGRASVSVNPQFTESGSGRQTLYAMRTALAALPTEADFASMEADPMAALSLIIP